MKKIALSALAALLIVTGASATGAAGPSPCAETPAAAATRFVSPQATIEGTSSVASLDVARAVDPRITPGFTTALLGLDGRWCSIEAFNAALSPGMSGTEIASAFASLAAMPYLGDVTISGVRSLGPIVSLTTTGGRHGAVSRWRIAVDAEGVRSASFTTTGWDRSAAEIAPTAGDLEGITSLPGHTRTFARTADGRVVIDATVDDLLERSRRERDAAVAKAAAIAGPGDDLKYTFEDGLTIKVSYGLSPYTPDAGVDTGVAQADRLRTIMKGVISHYKDFYRWGVRNPFDNTSRTLLGNNTGLPERAGYINVDSPLAPVCLACAYLADTMEVHIAYFFPELAPRVVPISYPDSEKFLQSVIAHEMVHGLQGGYSNGQGGVFTNAFIEGSARASESLHDIASNSFQTGAIHFNDSGNGCEGFENGRGTWIQAQANGPFNGHTYDACYFWWTYYATHGGEGLVNLLKAMPQAIATSSGSTAARNVRLLEVASADGKAGTDLARWGAAFAAGNDADGYTIPAGQTGQRLNWFSLLRPATRAATLQTSQSVTVAAGGARAFHVPAEGRVTQVPDGAVTCAFDNVDRQLVPSPVTVGTRILPGQILVVAAASGNSFTGTLGYAPGPVEPPVDPPPATCS